MRDISRGDVRLHRNLASNLPAILGDANELHQVVMNLLTNARDAVRGGDEISIQTRALSEPSAGAQLVVHDTTCAPSPARARRSC